MKRVINEIKQAEGMVRESLSSRTEEKKSNIFLVEIILIILFIVVFFTSNSYPIPMIKIFWKWVMVGIGALIIDGFMIKLWESKGHLKGFRWIFGITIIANFLLLTVMNILLWMVSKRDIDMDTFLMPFYIFMADLVAISAITFFGTCIMAGLEWFIMTLCTKNLMPDVRTVSFLLFIIFVKIIFWVVNYVMFAALNYRKKRKVEKEKRETLEGAAKREEKLDIYQVGETIEEKKAAINSIYSHAYDYIRAMDKKFQLLLLIIAYFIAAVFPTSVGMEAYGNNQAAFLNAVTIITLIMLFLDKSRDWDMKAARK